MLIYLIIIILGTAICALLNIFFNPMNEPWYFYAIYSVIITISLILIDALVAIIVRKMPERMFIKDKYIYRLGKREKKFYDLIGVKKWKEKIPELGGFTSFHKDRIADPFNNDYLNRFILEAHYGISIHLWSVPFGFLVIFLDYQMFLGTSNLFLTMAIPLACINAALVVAPAFILKYNLPKLVKIRDHNLRQQKMANEKSPS